MKSGPEGAIRGTQPKVQRVLSLGTCLGQTSPEAELAAWFQGHWLYNQTDTTS